MILSKEKTKIIIEHGFLFAGGISLTTSDSHPIFDKNTLERVNRAGDIIIGNNNWICNGVNFFKNSTISNDSVVGAFSLVTRKFFEDNVLIAGVPASIIKKEILWKISSREI